MPAVFWTGKLSLPLKVMVNVNNAVAWLTGSARDAAAMKQRVKLGYEGTFSDHVTRYDEVGLKHYTRIAATLVEGLDIQGKEVLDIGCGTGVVSLLLLEKGAKKVICGDQSEYMLGQCRKKAEAAGYDKGRIEFRQLDAEDLPFEDDRLDAVVSSMVMGMVPDQKKMVTEMARVLRPGGGLGLSTHGPTHYLEAIEASLKVNNPRYMFGYRYEYWPRDETEIQHLLSQAGLTDVLTSQLTWQETFESGGAAYDFMACTSSCWWYAIFPADKIAEDSQKIRDYFDRKEVEKVTSDCVIAYGRKP